MRALYGRDRRARRGRYFLRDLAGFAGVERLLANDAGGEHHSLDVADGGSPATLHFMAKDNLSELDDA